MAILPINNQYKYSKRGPFDAKALVKTYAELLSVDTWTVNGTVAAYNGMVTAVWLNTADSSKNGVYFLQDPAVDTILKTPDVTIETNWHKLAELSDLESFTDRLASINELTNRTQVLETVLNGSETQEGLISKVDENTATLLEIATEVSNKADLVALEANYYNKEEIDTALAEITTSNSEATAAIARELTAYTDTTDAVIASLEARVGTAKTEEAEATGLFARVDIVQEEVAQLIENTEKTSAKLNGISTTVLQAIEDAVNAVPSLEAATEDKLGGIKSSTGDNMVSVDEHGLASVKSVNINTLSQDEDDILILNGGSVVRL